MVISLKPGASLRGLRVEALLAFMVASSVMADMQLPDCVLTCATDSQHMPGSLHYVGLAIDIRTAGVPEPLKLVARLRTALNQEFDVVLESDHIHIEFQPKGPP
jgi:hypothetical protein